jgi:hypothetical protein
MKKYKLLRFDQCYLNKDGDFAVALVRGNKKAGYKFVVSHAYAYDLMYIGYINTLSRIVPNDGYWNEISTKTFNVVASFHSSGYAVKAPTSGEGLPVIFKV